MESKDKTEAGTHCRAGIATVHPNDFAWEFNVLLMARNEKRSCAAGSAVLIGTNNWQQNGNKMDTVIAVTAKHCLRNLPVVFEHPLAKATRLGDESLTIVPNWTLCAGQGVGGRNALWHCVWAGEGIDDLALLYLKPVNDVARAYRLRPPLICFGNPTIGDELWGFGHGACRELVDNPHHDFETTPRFAWGSVKQVFSETSRQERILANMPTENGMSGGGVFWARMLFGIISSTMRVSGCNEPDTFITRLRHVVNISIADAPAIDGERYSTVRELAAPGIVNLLGLNEGKQDFVVGVTKFQPESIEIVKKDVTI